jgi:hypothetical protein
VLTIVSLKLLEDREKVSVFDIEVVVSVFDRKLVEILFVDNGERYGSSLVDGID